ncbi:ABC transporter permease subunit, partial [Enterococcus sp. S181_ASV_20]|nr:ABC transporter permease subunit [Enterococcus sp. S181_ASV_20]
IPSIAMLTMLLILMGLGQNTVVATVVLYSLLPIVKNTYVGLVNVDPMYIDSAKGIGMNRYQILYMIKIPLAMTVIFAGV